MRLLDLFCGAGGAAMGYSRAGFTEIVGVDNKPQPRYPFTFVLGDALEYVKAHGHEFDAIHASPPCQAYSSATRAPGRHPDLYGSTQDEVARFSAWAIENVIGAPYAYGVILCGSMFSQPLLRRHRNFETSHLILQPACEHPDERPYTITGKSFVRDEFVSEHSRQTSFVRAKQIMGIDWMTRDELAQAIPPDYTAFIGKQLLQSIA